MDTRKTTVSSYRKINSAFTLIELLVVIAIISILAAILFPVAGTVREQARQSSTLSKLHSMYVSAKVYYEDEGRFPSSLFGYAETKIAGAVLPAPLVRPALLGDPIVPMDDATETFSTYPAPGSSFKTFQRGFLYREQIKDYKTFLCDDNPIRNKSAVTMAYWPLNSLISIRAGGTLANPIPVTWSQSDSTQNPKYYGDPDFPGAAYAGQPKLFYVMDSMDIGPALDADGKVIRDNTGAIRYELHYSPDWTHHSGILEDTDLSSPPKPVTTQLKYKFPPSERTIITSVTEHAATAGSPTTIVLLLSGTARKIDSKLMFQKAPLGL